MSFLTALGEYLYGPVNQPAFSEEELNLMRQGINPATQPEEEYNLELLAGLGLGGGFYADQIAKNTAARQGFQLVGSPQTTSSYPRLTGGTAPQYTGPTPGRMTPGTQLVPTGQAPAVRSVGGAPAIKPAQITSLSTIAPKVSSLSRAAGPVGLYSLADLGVKSLTGRGISERVGEGLGGAIGSLLYGDTSQPAFTPEELSQMQTYEQAQGLPPIQLEALERLSSAYDAPAPRGLTTVGGAPLSEFLSGAAMPEYGFTRSERQMAGRGTTPTQSQFDKLSAEREARMEADILSSRGAYVRDPNTGKKVAAGSKDHAIIIEAERAAERAGMTGSSKKNAFMALYKEQRQEEEELTKDLNDLKLQYETYKTQGQALNMERTRAQIKKYQKSEPERYEEIYSIAERLVNDGLLDEEQAVFFIINKMGGDIDDIFGEKGDVSSFIEQAISNVGGETSPVQEFFSVEEAEAANLPSGTKVIINGRTATVQ